MEPYANYKGFACIKRQKDNFAGKRGFTFSAEITQLPSPLTTLVALPIYYSVALCRS